MNKKVYAKSKDKESIQSHNQKLLDNYNKIKGTGYIDHDFIELYDKVIKRILSLHDLGKLNHKFQSKIRKAIRLDPIVIPDLEGYREIPHEWLSLAFISDEDRKYFKRFDQKGRIKFLDLVRYCIAFHHSRKTLADFDIDVYRKFVELDLEKQKEKINISYKLNPNIYINQVFEKIDKRFSDYFYLLVFLKGLLHKCDYCASAGVTAEQYYIGVYRNDFKSWLKIKDDEAKAVNRRFILKSFQKKALDLSDKSIVLIASTGVGKTEYSMNWINGSKAFYLLGIRTAVNEMFKRFQTVFGEKNTILLHGETGYFLADETDDENMYFEKLEKARKLSYPITIATADQLVTSVFKFNGFELQYFTASYSKTVVDEIQSFSPEAIASIVVFLQEIYSIGGKFLLMTATLPPFIKEEFKELKNIEFPDPVLTETKRHRIHCISSQIDDDQTIKLIHDKVNERQKVLVICNTVQKAQLVYEKINLENTYLLHSRFINKDRRAKEKDIMSFANDKETKSGIWISTQIVEASLDIDFDVLFTENATVDSLFQRFGRCFRKREYSKTTPNVYISLNSEISKKIYDPELMDKTWNTLAQYDLSLLTEEDKQEVIQKIFSNIEETIYYQKYKRYKELLHLGFRASNKSQAQTLFRNISNNYVIIPDPVYKNNKRVIDSLIHDIDNAKHLSNIERIQKKGQLKDYCFPVQLFQNKHDLLRELPSKFCRNQNIFILKGVDYSYQTGLSFKPDYKDYDNFI